MSKENRENIGAAVGLGLGALCALWCVSWLFHLGPDMEKAWWSFAYYISALGAALVCWATVATALYFAVQKFPLSANAEGGK